MSDLAQFLLNRITEDEAAARAAKPGPWHWEGDRSYHGEWRLVTVDPMPIIPDGPYDQQARAAHGAAWERRTVADGTACDDCGAQVKIADADAEYIVRWNPARVFAECDAKRALIATILDDWLTNLRLRDFLLAHIAIPYAQHPDFRDEWLDG